MLFILADKSGLYLILELRGNAGPDIHTTILLNHTPSPQCAYNNVRHCI